METTSTRSTAAPSVFSMGTTASSLASDLGGMQLGGDGDVDGGANGETEIDGVNALSVYNLPQPLPLWLHPQYSRHIAKGNFLTLSRLPWTVEPGEWLAHQMVEHCITLCHFVRVVCEKEDGGTSICNAQTCPTMSAGPLTSSRHTYTWMTADREVVAVSAREYMSLVQRWITRLIDDEALFPTDQDGVSSAPGPWPQLPSGSGTDSADAPDAPDWVGRGGGFPRRFVAACRQIARQIARVYAHLYWAHFVDPFFHLSLEKALNSCFCHFVLSTTAPVVFIGRGGEAEQQAPLLLPQDLDLVPMLPLLDLWAANGMCPPRSEAYRFANKAAGRQLLRMGGVGVGG